MKLKLLDGKLIPADLDSQAEVNKLVNGGTYELRLVDSGITDAQRRATHKFFKDISKHLNDNGYTMSIILKDGAPWGQDGMDFKSRIWKVMVEALYGKKSSEKLNPDEVNEVYMAVCAALADKGVGDIPTFPTWRGE